MKGKSSWEETVRKASQEVNPVSDPGLGPPRVGGTPVGRGNAGQGAATWRRRLWPRDGAAATVFRGAGSAWLQGLALPHPWQ